MIETPGTIRLTNDFVFKRVFGREETRDILLPFVNAVLLDAGMPRVVELTVKNPELPRDTGWLRTAILDILAEDESGRRFDIEVQVEADSSFGNRSLYYWARGYADQLGRGDPFGSLRPVVCINLLDFALLPDIERAHTCYMVHETTEREYVLTDHLSIHIIELPKRAPEGSPLWPWLRYIQSEGTTEDEAMKILLKDEPIRRAHEEYRRCMEDEQERAWAFSREMFQRDLATRFAHARQSGLDEGLEKGLEKGRQEGAHTQAVQTARKLLAARLAVGTIAEATGLSVEEIESLRSE